MKEKRRGQTLRRWQLSYVMMLLLPLIFGCVIYFHSLSTIHRETEELLYQMLLQDEAVLKNMLGQLRKEGTELLNSSYVKSLSMSDLTPEFERDRLGMVQSLLQNRLSASETLSNLYLFYPGRELVVGSRVCFRLTEEMWIQEDYRLSDPAIQTIMEGNPYNRLYLLRSSKSDALVYSMAGNYRGDFWEQEVVLVCFLNNLWLEEQFLDNDTAVLLQTEDKTFRKIGGGLEPEEKTGGGKIGQEYQNKMTKKEQLVHQNGYAILKRELSDYKVSLFCIRQDKAFRQELMLGIGILVLYVAACLAAGLSLSSFLSKRNYKPVDDILKLIRKGNPIGEQEDEFDLIRSRILRLLRGYEKKAEESFRQEQLVRDAEISRFLLGQRNKYASLEEEEQKRLKQTLPYKAYIVVQFDFEEVEEALFGEQLNEESLQLLYFVVRNVAGDILGEGCPFLSGSLGGCCYFIINQNEEPEAAEQKAAENIAEVIAFLQQTYGFQICANISRAGTGLTELEAEYQQVRRLNEYRNHAGTPYVVLTYSQMEERLTEWEAESRQAKIQQTEEIKGASAKPEASARKSALSDRKGSLEETIENIQHWLKEHYQEKQLTVAVVAEQFSMNLTYLSRVFKQKTGTGVLDYINQLRVERAKELLQEGYTVKAAAEEIGYYTVRPLMRAFREQVGMTPGEYAKLQTEDLES